MKAQIVMILMLAFLTICAWIKIAYEEKELSKIVGGFIGIATRYGLIAYVAWCGGFWGLS